MKLVVTIDTEEDNWSNYSRVENPCTNIKQLLMLQELFDSYNLVPTYLITYPVVQDSTSKSIFKKILNERKCEIGTHCHPWNTPPFEEMLCTRNTMLSNLSSDLVLRKITTLHNAIIETFKVTPVSFRAGRFAFNNHVAKALVTLGYKIDVSITPYEDQSPYSGPNFSNCSPTPYPFSERDIFSPKPDGRLVEVPISTGYLQKNFALANCLYKFFHHKSINRLRITGILSKFGLVNMVRLCPETNSEKEMIKITKVFRKKDFKIINMMFHSTSLKAGLSPFTRTLQDELSIFKRIKTFLQFAKDIGIENIRISEAADLVRSTL